MKPTELAVLLNGIPTIGPVRFWGLLDRFGSLEGVAEASVEELRSVEGVSETAAGAIRHGIGQRAGVEKEMGLAEAHGIRILTQDDPAYPDLLRQLHDAPPVLYCKGDLDLLKEPSVALVGSRRPTPYGVKMAESLAEELAGMGIAVVSGLARGIDAAAHQAALRAKGATLAVLGSGLLDIYPPENRRLAETIGVSGLLLSEFPLRMPPEAGHFPRRNRIIAGLSLGTVVVEADEKSGALVTARLAAEQGKDIFAVPGPAFSKMSRGPHRLIRQGAKLVENAQDILEEIAPLRTMFAAGAPVRPRGAEIAELSAPERKLNDLIQLEPLHIDALAVRSALPAGELSQALLNLEMKGVVKSLPGKLYVRN